jgi:hypothetical protein
VKFLCPRCLKIADVEPTSPEHEIVSVYCLHAGTWIDGGSEPIRMVPVTDPVPGHPEPATAGS